MKKAAVPSILVAVVLLAVGVMAEAQQPTKIPRIGYLTGPPFPLVRSGKHSVRVCTSSVTLKVKTLSSSGDLGKENAIASTRLLQNWCVSR